MARAPASRTTVEGLAEHLRDGEAGKMTDELRRWLAASPRFRAFADAHRDKIRKKLRGAIQPGALLDVRAELRVAYLLTADRNIQLAFEAYGSGRRGPDFTLTHRGSRPFNLEVTRLRPATALASPIVAKLRQLPPSVPNALLLALDGPGASAADIEAAVGVLRERAAARDDAPFVARGLDGARDFRARVLRLGAVIAWTDSSTGAIPDASRWINPVARIRVPDRPLRACLAALRGVEAAAP